MRGVALSEIPVSHLVGVAQRSTTFYKHRSSATLGIGVSWIIRAAVKFVYNFFDEFQKKKFTIFGDDFVEHFDESIGLENLEEKFGGKLPNVEDNFWPPHFNHDDLRL